MMATRSPSAPPAATGVIRVLVVDDSAFMRFTISKHLNDAAGMQVVASAHDGEEVPIDIELENTEAWVDESVLTGESIPQRKVKGQKILEGAKSCGSELYGRVFRPSSESSLSCLIDRLRAVSVSVPIARFEQIFTAAVMLLVLLVLIVDRDAGFSKALALLVVTCPCALLLAKPLILDKAKAEALRQGLFLLNPFRFLNAARFRRIFFDKTGTLTDGQSTLAHETELLPYPVDFRRALCSLAVQSQHPLSRSLALYLNEGLKDRDELSHFREIEGLGIEASWKGQLVSLVRPTFATQSPSVSAYLDGREAICFEFIDRARDEAKASLERLQSLGFSIGILSGDRISSVKKFSDSIQIRWAELQGELSPEAKAKYILSTDVFVGDGLNDAISMKTAGFSIGFSGSAESNLSSADAYLIKKDLRLIPQILLATQNAQRLLHLSYGVSIVYNLITIALVLNGSIGPIICAVFMPLSSLTVLLIARSFRMRSVDERIRPQPLQSLPSRCDLSSKARGIAS